MKKWNTLPLSGLLLLAVLGLSGGLTTSAFAVNPSFSLSLGFDFASGDYGTTQTSDSYSVPLTIGYYPTKRLDFSLEIPYLYQSDSSTVFLGGTRFTTGSGTTSGGGSGSGGGGPMGAGGQRSLATAATVAAAETPDAAVAGSAVTSSSSQSGLGDINLTIGYVLLAESASVPLIRPLAYVKVPTADEEKGLGTGAFDFGAGLSLAKGVGAWFLYAETLYMMPGSTSTYEPDDYWTYQASVNYQLSRSFDAGFALSGATAAFDGNPAALEVQLSTKYWVSSQGSLGAYVGTGLSDSSPDYTAGFYGAISF